MWRNIISLSSDDFEAHPHMWEVLRSLDVHAGVKYFNWLTPRPFHVRVTCVACGRSTACTLRRFGDAATLMCDNCERPICDTRRVPMHLVYVWMKQSDPPPEPTDTPVEPMRIRRFSSTFRGAGD
jgi:hypothetical protein